MKTHPSHGNIIDISDVSPSADLVCEKCGRTDEELETYCKALVLTIGDRYPCTAAQARVVLDFMAAADRMIAELCELGGRAALAIEKMPHENEDGVRIVNGANMAARAIAETCEYAVNSLCHMPIMWDEKYRKRVVRLRHLVRGARGAELEEIVSRADD